MIEQNNFKNLSIIVVFGILILVSFIIIRPIFTAIITGLILSYIFYPVYKKIYKVVKEKNISAIIIILLVLFLILIPLWFLLPIIVKQVFNVYLSIQKINFYSYLLKIVPSLAESQLPPEIISSVNTFMTGILSKIISSISSIFLDMPSLLLKVAVMIFIFFFGMRDGEIFFNYVRTLSPFSKAMDEELAEKFEGVTKSVIYGQIIVGIIQGLLAGVGLFVFKVPQALLLSVIVIFLSMIPLLGAWLVWLPASIYLIFSGDTFNGIGLLLYGALFVSWIDNVIRSYIVARRIKISSAIILAGMIGGLMVFGILGLIIGPLILSYLLLFLDAYRKNKLPSLFSEEKTPA